MRMALVVAGLGVVLVCAVLVQDSEGPFHAAVLLLLLALPAGIFGAYLAALRRIHWLTVWSADSLAVRWLSGSSLRILFALLLSLVAAGILMVRLSVAGWLDLALMAVCGLFLVVVNAIFGARLRGQFTPIFRYGQSLLVFAVFASLLVSLLDPIARHVFGSYQVYADPADAIAAVLQSPDRFGNSALSEFAKGLAATWVGFERYAVGNILADSESSRWWVFIVVTLLKFPLYLSVAFSVCALALPKREYQRIVASSIASEKVEKPSWFRVAMASATVTITVFFIYLPLVAFIEGNLQERGDSIKPDVIAAVAVEIIGDQRYRPGTIREIQRRAAIEVQKQGDVLRPIEAALAAGFAQMRESVDDYLDWYYSLPGEWSRMAMLLTGNFEDFLAEKLEKMLSAGEPFEEFQREFSSALGRQEERVESFRGVAEDILRAGQVDLSEEHEFTVVARADRESLLSLPAHSGLTTLEQRLGVTAATTGVSGVVAAAATRQILVRAAARGTFKAAAQAMIRLAVIRSGSVGGGGALGSLIGGAIGSVVPGIGTAIGAGVGGVLGGLVVGVSAEFLILKLEELIARNEHRVELLEAINEAEKSLREQWGLSPQNGS